MVKVGRPIGVGPGCSDRQLRGKAVCPGDQCQVAGRGPKPEFGQELSSPTVSKEEPRPPSRRLGSGFDGEDAEPLATTDAKGLKVTQVQGQDLSGPVPFGEHDD